MLSGWTYRPTSRHTCCHVKHAVNHTIIHLCPLCLTGTFRDWEVRCAKIWAWPRLHMDLDRGVCELLTMDHYSTTPRVAAHCVPSRTTNKRKGMDKTVMLALILNNYGFFTNYPTVGQHIKDALWTHSLHLNLSVVVTVSALQASGLHNHLPGGSDAAASQDSKQCFTS